MALCGTKLRRRQPRRQGPAPIETGSSSAKATAKIVGLFLAGLALAAGHHLFNTRIHGTTVETALGSLAAIREGSFRQADALRIGSAFGEKAAATPLFSTITDTCVDSDHLEDTPRCRNWVRARPERLAHRAVDAIFSITTDMFAYLTWDLWKSSPLVVVLSAVFWSLPIVAVLTPSSLTTRQVVKITDSMAVVPHFDASEMKLYSCRDIFTGLLTYNNPKLDSPRGRVSRSVTKCAEEHLTCSQRAAAIANFALW